MADLSDPESWRSSHGYDTESESVLVDESRYGSNDPHNLLDTDDDDDDGQDSDTDSESDGGLFVPPHSPSPGPSVISLLSASESGPDDGEIYHQLYFDNLDPADEEDLAREELQRELEEIIPELRGHVNDARLGLPQLHPRWSEGINEEDEDEHLDLFGEDDFDGTDDDGLDDDGFEEAYAEAFEEDEDEDEEAVNGGLHLPLPHIPPSHHHHPLHHLFHYPRLPTVHPDIVLGVNPLQHLGPRLNFLPPHLHEHLQRASLSPALPPLHRARMDRSTRSRNAGQARQRDELVNVELAGGSGSGSGRSLRGRPQNQQQGQRAAAPDVIDLTGDDAGEDNGDLNFEVVMEGSQNVRRQQSQRRDNAPRLNRSDSNYMGHQPQPPVIDISSDSEDDPLQARPALSLPNPANNHARHHHHRHVHHHHHLPRPHHHHHAHWPPMDGGAPRRAAGANNARGINNARGDMNPRGVFGQLIDAVISGIGVNTNRGRDEDLVMIGPPANFPPMPAPVPNLGPIQFNYAAQPFAPGAPAAGPQKPPHEPPPKARDGFTRDTGEDQVVICPSCNEELAYDPDDEDENGPPTKKARTKKDRAEHHFWAVKDCGHVFCKKCFDNRRSTSSRNAVKVGFKHCPQNPKKILCAVDGCNTDVSGKASWVGLFL